MAGGGGEYKVSAALLWNLPLAPLLLCAACSWTARTCLEVRGLNALPRPFQPSAQRQLAQPGVSTNGHCRHGTLLQVLAGFGWSNNVALSLLDKYGWQG